MPENELGELLPRAPSRERIGYIDSLKGFAALSVVLGHVTEGYINAGMYPGHPSMLVLHNTVYSFHMALFMLVSGYLFYTAYFDAQGKPKMGRIHRQTLNLVIIYIVYDIAFGLLKIVCSAFTNYDISWNDVLLFPVRPIAPYWYIYILILYYIIFSPGFVYRQSKITFCVTLFACAFSIFISFGFFSVNSLLYFAFFFWTGICYRNGTAPWFGSTIVSASFFIISVSVYVLTYGTNIPQTIPGVKMVIALGISQGIWYAFEHFPALRNNRLLSCLGRHALEIYLIHGIFTAGARTVFPDFILEHYILSVSLNVAISAALPVLFAYCCKKLSVHDLFFKPVVWLEKLKKA